MSHTGSVYSEEVVSALQQEIKKLKEEKEREYDGRCADNDENEAREKKLKEENSILKVKLSGAMDLLLHGESDDEESESEDEDSTDLINDLENELTDVRGTVRWLKDQLEKAREDLSVESTCLQIVKDENEVNKKNMFKFMEDKRKLDKVCETLVKEAEENQKKMKYYQFYIYTLDGSGDCDLTKEDVDKFTDDQKLREYLYEEIGYEEEEEETKYDADDWTQCYGFTTKDGEYRMNIAGGGSHWEDYVITRDRNFIHNKCGESIVSTFISCPESTYVKVVHIGEDYKLEEGETDMYDMVQECFQEEIMEYVKEEEVEEESEEEEEEYKIEINVVGLGFCRYIDEEDRDKKVVHCKNDCWKIRGDKTAKDDEGNYCETDEEEEEVVGDINGKESKIPTEEECQKTFGVSREDFIMLAKQSDCAY